MEHSLKANCWHRAVLLSHPAKHYSQCFKEIPGKIRNKNKLATPHSSGLLVNRTIGEQQHRVSPILCSIVHHLAMIRDAHQIGQQTAAYQTRSDQCTPDRPTTNSRRVREKTREKGTSSAQHTARHATMITLPQRLLSSAAKARLFSS